MRSLMVALLISISLHAAAQDVIHLKTGESAVCEIEAVTDNIVVFLMRGPGGGSAKRSLPMDRVAYLEFGFEEGEEAVLSNIEQEKVENLESWREYQIEH